jgi:hypothetical protein
MRCPPHCEIEIMSQINGGCACDQLRFSINSDPIFQAVCHCRTCQRHTGSAFRVVVAVSRSAVSMRGASNIYKRTGDSGQLVINRFCPDCGGTVAIEPAALAEMTIIPVGTLDDPSWVKPTMEIYCDSAQPWVQLGDGMERFAGMRPGHLR